jgi:hypothetical protein
MGAISALFVATLPPPHEVLALGGKGGPGHEARMIGCGDSLHFTGRRENPFGQSEMAVTWCAAMVIPSLAPGRFGN